MITLYLVRPDYGTSGREDEVVRQYDRASGLIDTAIELARLAGDEKRAQAIDDVWLRPFGREPRLMTTEDIDEMLQLIDGLEDSLVGRVVDAQWKVKPAQLPDLRARTKTLELDDSRDGAELYAVGEAMTRVGALREILKEAKSQGLFIALNPW